MTEPTPPPGNRSKITRPWANQGDNWEIIIPEYDYTSMLPGPDSPEWAEMVQNYIRNRYGGGTENRSAEQ
jgi:hypothetical protein